MNLKIAARLVDLRKTKGMSQENVAEKLGVSRQAISRWERAESTPDMNNFIELAKLYEVSLDDLLDIDISKNKNDNESKHNSCCDKKDILIAQVPFPFVIPVYIILGLFGFHEGYNWIGKSKPNAMQRFPLPIIILSIYIIVSIITKAWNISWIIMMIIPIYYVIAAVLKFK